jgi:hypothetical protein
MKRNNVAKAERDRLVKVAAERKLKVRRTGRTVKQQIAVLNAAIK